jgi:hypothetical protein
MENFKQNLIDFIIVYGLSLGAAAMLAGIVVSVLYAAT